MGRVLIADDEEFVRIFIRTTLESFGHIISGEVEDGIELVGALNEHKPNILLLDINMPNMGGLEFLREHASEFPSTCIIILTSVTNEVSVRKCKLLGAMNVLRKDTPVTEMIDEIDKTWEEFKKEHW